MKFDSNFDLCLMDEEIEDNPEVETLEENLSVEDMELSNLDLVRVDMNVIEYPLFSRNNHRKKNQSVKYFFNNNKDIYIKVSPVAGDHIPGELEEKVFIILLKIMKRKGFPHSFYVSSSEIISELGNKNKAYYDRVKKAMLRLSRTHYDFKNTLYLNKINQTVNQLVSTNMLNLEIIELAKSKELQKEYNDSRIKEVYKISISDHFYENIIRKGYLVYDAKTLLEFDNSISRSLYMLLTKLRYENLNLQLPILYLIKRIPLKYEEKNLYRTVKILETACEDLEKKHLIEGFNLIKNRNWKESEIEFFFSSEHNKMKQLNFFDDKNYFTEIINSNNQLMISHTEESETLLEQIKKEHQEKNITNEDVERIIKILPEKARQLKTLPKFLKTSALTYGLEHLIKVAEYVKSQKPRSILGYFSKALEQDWASDYILSTKEEIPVAKAEEPKKIEIQENSQDKLNEELKEKYKQLPSDEKEEIEKQSFAHYLKKAGGNSAILKIAFQNGKSAIISEYLKEIRYFDSPKQKENPEIILKKEIPEEKKELILDRKAISKIIRETTDKFSLIYGLSGEEELDLKVRVAEELLKEGNLTEPVVNKIFQKMIEKLQKNI